MEQPQGEPQTGDNTSANDQIVTESVKTRTHNKRTSEGGDSKQDKPARKNAYAKNTLRRKAKRYWLKLTREGPDRHIELLLAFVIALFAFMQWHTAKNNSESATQQMGQLIAAAKISAYAARQNVIAAQAFAISADKMDK